MSGYTHQFKRNYTWSDRLEPLEKLVKLGSVDEDHIQDPPPSESFSVDQYAIGRLDAIALQLLPPRKSENFLGPVDDVSAVGSQCAKRTLLTFD